MGLDFAQSQYESFVLAAGLFSGAATLISLWSMWHHLKRYHQPGLQRWVIRLLWMTPVYAITSWFSLQSVDAAYYLDTVRDVYEGFVIYSFFILLVNYLGGERALLIMLHNRPATPHLWPVNYWFKEMVVGDPYSYLFLKRGILQYVYIKPVLAIVTMLLKSNQVYEDGDFSLANGYFWVSFVYNLSVSLCLYCLAIFFMATKADLRPFRPFPKFLCVKAILFFSFWQGLGISVLVSVGIIHNTPTVSAENIAVFVQDWLICLEMVFAAVGHWYSFSYTDFLPTKPISGRLPLKYAFKDAIGIKDIILDSVDTYTGEGFSYRAFDPVEEPLPHQPGDRPQLRPGDAKRLMAGMRYAHGGATKYWLPVDGRSGTPVAPSDRTPLLGGNGGHGVISLGNDLPGYLSDNTAHDAALTSPPLFDDDLNTPENRYFDRLFADALQLPAEGDANCPVIDTSTLPRTAYTRPTYPGPRSISSGRGSASSARRLRSKGNGSSVGQVPAPSGPRRSPASSENATPALGTSPPRQSGHLARPSASPTWDAHRSDTEATPWNNDDTFYRASSPAP